MGVDSAIIRCRPMRWMISCKKVTEINWAAAITARRSMTMQTTARRLYGLLSFIYTPRAIKRMPLLIFQITLANVDRL